ncbi:MAG: LuxR C-terminal-related transcriptional regulator [Phycisphaerales bacterium]
MSLDGVGSPSGVALTTSDTTVARSPAAQVADLTDREREILGLIGMGLSMSDIAKRLNRTIKTVEWYRGSLGKKLRAKNRVQLARIAIGAGLTSDPAGAPASAAPEHRLGAFEQALSAVDSYIWLWDDTQRRLEISESLLSVTGYKSSEFEDLRFAFARLSDPSALEELVVGIFRSLSSGGNAFDVPVRLVHKDGSRLVMRALGKIDRDTAGIPLRWRGITSIVDRLPPAAVPKPALDRIGAFEWDARDDHYEACPNTFRLLRRQPGSIGTRLKDWGAIIDPTHRDSHALRLREAADSHATTSVTVRTPRTCGDSRARLFDDNLVFLRAASGDLMRVVGTTTLVA